MAENEGAISHPGSNENLPLAPAIPLWMQPEGRWLIAGALGIILLTFFSYVPALTAGYIWDDDLWLTQNKLIRSFDGLRKIWLEPRASSDYYPLTSTTFWIEYRFWGLHPFGYHLVNIILHALNAVLLWRLMKMLAIPGAWFIGAIFAVHPVHVESVAWVTERKNVLSGIFYLLSATAFFRYYFQELSADAAQSSEENEEDYEEEEDVNRPYQHSMFLYVCAILAKTVTVTLPVMLLIGIWWKRGKITARDLKLVAPYFGIGLAAGVFAIWMQLYHTGAAGQRFELDAVERVLIAGRAIWFYLWKLVLPINLVFIYPRWEIDSSVIWQWILPLAAIGVLIALWTMRRRIGRAPVAAALFFVLTLSPALGFVNIYWQIYSFVADHVQYIASIGIVAGIVAGLTQWLRRRGPGALRNGSVVGSVVLLIFAVLTWRQTLIYKDAETLWRATLEDNPNAYMVHTNLAHALKNQGRLEEAYEHYLKALELEPNLGETRLDHGTILEAMGRVEEALVAYESATHDGIKAPAWFEGHFSRAELLRKKGRLEEALQAYVAALPKDPSQRHPNHAKAWVNFGALLEKMGKLEDAARAYGWAVEADPEMALAFFNLANLMRNDGLKRNDVAQLDKAVNVYFEAIAADPDYAEAHFNLGQLLLRRGLQQEGVQHLDTAVRLKPELEQQIEEWAQRVQATTTTSPATTLPAQP